MAERRSSTTEVEVTGGWQLVTAGALVLVSCDPTPSQAHPYAPASVGDTWVYAIPQSYPGATMPATESVERIVRAERRGDRLVARVRSEYFGSTSERDLVITPLGVSPDIGAMTTSVGDVTVRAAEGVFLPRELSPGMRWDWRQELDSSFSRMSVSGRCEVVGPAEFQGLPAVHVRCETRNRMIATAKDNPVQQLDHVQTEDNDYVRGIGLVRSVTTTPAGYRSEKLLVRWQVAGAANVDTPMVAGP